MWIHLADILQMIFDGSELIGTIAFAASGAMLAIDRDLDLFGVVFLGVMTAVGGGIVRDMVLGSFPPNAFRNSVYVAVACITALVVFCFAEFKGNRYWRQRSSIDRVINLLDALGLGIFSVVGANTAMQKGFADNAFLCIFMGMTTGVGGGILRDLLSQTVPAVLKKRIYAVASIAGGSAFYAAMQLGCSGAVSMLIGMILTIIVRILATYFMWDLPKVPRQ